MPEFLVGQPGQAGSGQVLRHILGTALRDEKQSFSEVWRRTWASALSLMLLHWRPSGYSKVCNLPVCHPCQARLAVVPSPGWHFLPGSHSPLSITFLPLFLSHSCIPTFPSNFSISFHQDLPAQGPLERCSHQQWQRLGRKAQPEAEGRNWPLFLGADQIEIQMILQRQLEASPPRGKSSQAFQ